MHEIVRGLFYGQAISMAPVRPPMWQSSDVELLAELGALETQLHATRRNVVDQAGSGSRQIVRSALSPLAAPRPATDTEIDLRTTAQRDADALVELAQRALISGELPTEGGERPQVVVT